jgi:hypothetical protein
LDDLEPHEFRKESQQHKEKLGSRTISLGAAEALKSSHKEKRAVLVGQENLFCSHNTIFKLLGVETFRKACDLFVQKNERIWQEEIETDYRC